MSEVYKLLTDEDKEKISNYIEDYAFLTTNKKDINIEISLREWANNKKTLCKMLGNKLIVSRPYTFEVETEYLKNEFDRVKRNEKSYSNLLNALVDIWVDNQNWFDNNFGVNRTFYTFYSLEPYIQFSPIIVSDLINSEHLATNSWDGPEFKVTFPSGHTYKVTPGMRITKLIKKLFDEFDGPQDVYEDFRIWHSKKLNQKYIDGELCLSIHPLDFMTMSDNDNNWTSCMRWSNGHGDYCTGTLECLNSPYIIEAYLHNPSNPMEIGPNMTWNNKKWRELFIVNEELITEIKGYPYQDSNLTNTVLMWLKELTSANLGWTYDNEEANVADEVKHENKIYHINFEPSRYMYNDFGSLDVHRARINYKNLDKLSRLSYNKKYSNVDIPYGGIATCMCCGKDIDTNDDNEITNLLVCFECEGGSICPICGNVMSPNSGSFINDFDDPICDSCFENYTTIDDLSEEPCYNDTALNVSWYLGKGIDGNPVWHNYSFTTTGSVDINDNYYYNLYFNSPIKNIAVKGLYGGYTKLSVTLDMVKEDALDYFARLFDLYNTNLNAIYQRYGVVEPACTDISRFKDSEYFDETEYNLFF